MENTPSVITSALADVTTIFTTAVNMITGSPIALAFIGISLAGAGVGLFKRVKRA